MQRLEYEDVDLSNERYIRGEKAWYQIDLINAAEKQECKPFDFPLIGIDLSNLPFTISCLDDFIWQCLRVERCNLDYPIILDDLGQIANGNHRIVRAIIEGRETIKAIRLKYMPDKWHEYKQ